MNAKTHSQAESLEDRPRGLQEEIWAQFRKVLRQELKAMLEQVLECPTSAEMRLWSEVR
jgi:hypothetical protein